MEWQEIMREVGSLTEDNQLVRGVLTVGATTLAVALTVWRALRRKDSIPRVKIDAPANVRITAEPVLKGDEH